MKCKHRSVKAILTALSGSWISLGLLQTLPAQAADVVCQGVTGNTEFVAPYGEVGFGLISLRNRQTGRQVEVPMAFIQVNDVGQSVFRGTHPERPSDTLTIVAPRSVVTGSQISLSYNGIWTRANCTATTISNPDTSVSPPSSGSFDGMGMATGSVFTRDRDVQATLSYSESNNFSMTVYVPPGLNTDPQIIYTGRITRLTGDRGASANSFTLLGQIESVSSSINGLRSENASGQCRIEVADARITSARCMATGSRNNMTFRGRAQF